MDLPPVQISTLAQLSGGQDWRLALPHDRPEHLIVWITRGQGRALLNGTRRGIGTHNALIIPARTLFAIDLGRQGMGQVALIPDGTEIRLPETPRHLRLRDVAAINEITTLFDTAQREATQKRPLVQDALDAHVALISVWVRRQIAQPEHLPQKHDAAARLTAHFCEGIVQSYASPMTMADHAAALGVTPTHLSRACKAATGRTAADLLTQRTLYAARVALTETKVPVQDIARHLGFGSAAYFTRFMQQHTGQSPTALRQSAG
ncbi:MAG: AraC family transcriptional regulator [Pseudomonadota bacterium]